MAYSHVFGRALGRTAPSSASASSSSSSSTSQRRRAHQAVPPPSFLVPTFTPPPEHQQTYQGPPQTPQQSFAELNDLISPREELRPSTSSYHHVVTTSAAARPKDPRLPWSEPSTSRLSPEASCPSTESAQGPRRRTVEAHHPPLRLDSSMEAPQPHRRTSIVFPPDALPRDWVSAPAAPACTPSWGRISLFLHPPASPTPTLPSPPLPRSPSRSRVTLEPIPPSPSTVSPPKPPKARPTPKSRPPSFLLPSPSSGSVATPLYSTPPSSEADPIPERTSSPPPSTLSSPLSRQRNPGFQPPSRSTRRPAPSFFHPPPSLQPAPPPPKPSSGSSSSVLARTSPPSPPPGAPNSRPRPPFLQPPVSLWTPPSPEVSSSLPFTSSSASNHRPNPSFATAKRQPTPSFILLPLSHRPPPTHQPPPSPPPPTARSRSRNKISLFLSSPAGDQADLVPPPPPPSPPPAFFTTRTTSPLAPSSRSSRSPSRPSTPSLSASPPSFLLQPRRYPLPPPRPEPETESRNPFLGSSKPFSDSPLPGSQDGPQHLLHNLTPPPPPPPPSWPFASSAPIIMDPVDFPPAPPSDEFPRSFFSRRTVAQSKQLPASWYPREVALLEPYLAREPADFPLDLVADTPLDSMGEAEFNATRMYVLDRFNSSEVGTEHWPYWKATDFEKEALFEVLRYERGMSLWQGDWFNKMRREEHGRKYWSTVMQLANFRSSIETVRARSSRRELWGSVEGYTFWSDEELAALTTALKGSIRFVGRTSSSFSPPISHHSSLLSNLDWYLLEVRFKNALRSAIRTPLPRNVFGAYEKKRALEMAQELEGLRDLLGKERVEWRRGEDGKRAWGTMTSIVRLVEDPEGTTTREPVSQPTRSSASGDVETGSIDFGLIAAPDSLPEPSFPPPSSFLPPTKPEPFVTPGSQPGLLPAPFFSSSPVLAIKPESSSFGFGSVSSAWPRSDRVVLASTLTLNRLGPSSQKKLGSQPFLLTPPPPPPPPLRLSPRPPASITASPHLPTPLNKDPLLVAPSLSPPFQPHLPPPPPPPPGLYPFERDVTKEHGKFFVPVEEVDEETPWTSWGEDDRGVGEVSTSPRHQNVPQSDFSAFWFKEQILQTPNPPLAPLVPPPPPSLPSLEPSLPVVEPPKPSRPAPQRLVFPSNERAQVTEPTPTPSVEAEAEAEPSPALPSLPSPPTTTSPVPSTGTPEQPLARRRQIPFFPADFTPQGFGAGPAPSAKPEPSSESKKVASILKTTGIFPPPSSPPPPRPAPLSFSTPYPPFNRPIRRVQARLLTLIHASRADLPRPRPARPLRFEWRFLFPDDPHFLEDVKTEAELYWTLHSREEGGHLSPERKELYLKFLKLWGKEARARLSGGKEEGPSEEELLRACLRVVGQTPKKRFQRWKVRFNLTGAWEDERRRKRAEEEVRAALEGQGDKEIEADIEGRSKQEEVHRARERFLSAREEVVGKGEGDEASGKFHAAMEEARRAAVEARSREEGVGS